jgi:hypothetical protein
MMIIILSAFPLPPLPPSCHTHIIIIIIIIMSNSKRPTHSQSKPPSPIYGGTYRGKTKKGLDEIGNKISYMMLYVLQTALYRK